MHYDEINIPQCGRCSDISSYLDGELSPGDELSLEEHFLECSECRTEFNLQKQFYNALTSTLETDLDLELPDNFTKAIVAAAESDVDSLRRSNEVRNAAAIVIGILVIATAVAIVTGNVTANGLGVIIDKVLAVIVATGHLVFSFALGLSVLVRSATSGIGGQIGIWLAVAVGSVLFVLIPIIYFRPRRPERVRQP